MVIKSEAYDDNRHACGYVWCVSRCKKNTDSVAGIVLLWTIPIAIEDARTGRNQELGIRAREGKAEAGKPHPPLPTPHGSPKTSPPSPYTSRAGRIITTNVEEDDVLAPPAPLSTLLPALCPGEGDI